VPDEGDFVLLPGGHDAGLLASESCDNTVRIWAVDTGNRIQTMKGHINGVHSVSFNDAALLATGSGDNKIWASLAKGLSSRLFDYLVAHINSSMEMKSDQLLNMRILGYLRFRDLRPERLQTVLHQLRE